MTKNHRPFVLGAALLGATGLLGVLFIKGESTNDGLPGLGNSESPSQRSTDTPLEFQSRPNGSTPRGAQTEAQPERRTPPAETLALVCRRASDGSGLAGVRVYESGSVTAGPSDEQGRLRLPAPGWGQRTFWVDGWVPLRLAGPQLPAELRFEPANTGLDLKLQRATLHHKVIRSLLQPRAQDSPPAGPWTPELLVESWDHLSARGVPAGNYDIYLWVSEDGGTPEPYSLIDVTLPAGERVELSIDLLADRQDTTESDS